MHGWEPTHVLTSCFSRGLKEAKNEFLVVIDSQGICQQFLVKICPRSWWTQHKWFDCPFLHSRDLATRKQTNKQTNKVHSYIKRTFKPPGQSFSHFPSVCIFAVSSSSEFSFCRPNWMMTGFPRSWYPFTSSSAALAVATSVVGIKTPR